MGFVRGQAGPEDSNGSKEVAALKDVLHNPAPWRTLVVLEMMMDPNQRLFWGDLISIYLNGNLRIPTWRHCMALYHICGHILGGYSNQSVPGMTIDNLGRGERM